MWRHMTRAQTKRVHVYGSYDAAVVFVFGSLCVCWFSSGALVVFLQEMEESTQAKTQN